MKDYEINVPDIKLNYWYSHWQQTVVIRGPRPQKKPPYHALRLLPLLVISRRAGEKNAHWQS